MASPGQHGMRIFGTQRTAVAGLAFAIVLVLAVGATEAAQAQTYKVIHNFAGGLDGAEPSAGVTMDGAGNLYGTTFEGDALTGTVFKLTHKNSSWVLSPLFLFTEGGSSGAIPYAKVIFGPDGTLYGTTGYGGNPQNCIGGCGTVFNLKPKPNPPVTPLSPWLERAIYPLAEAVTEPTHTEPISSSTRRAISTAPLTTAEAEVAVEGAVPSTSLLRPTAPG